MVLVRHEQDVPPRETRIRRDLGDAIQHRALEIELQHDTEPACKRGIERDGKVQAEDTPLLDQIFERRQRGSRTWIAPGRTPDTRRGCSSNSDRKTTTPSTIDALTLLSSFIPGPLNQRLMALSRCCRLAQIACVPLRTEKGLSWAARNPSTSGRYWWPSRACPASPTGSTAPGEECRSRGWTRPGLRAAPGTGSSDRGCPDR